MGYESIVSGKVTAQEGKEAVFLRFLIENDCCPDWMSGKGPWSPRVCRELRCGPHWTGVCLRSHAYRKTRSLHGTEQWSVCYGFEDLVALLHEAAIMGYLETVDLSREGDDRNDVEGYTYDWEHGWRHLVIRQTYVAWPGPQPGVSR